MASVVSGAGAWRLKRTAVAVLAHMVMAQRVKRQERMAAGGIEVAWRVASREQQVAKALAWKEPGK